MSDLGLNNEKLLEIKNLKVNFYTAEGVAKAINGIDFDIFHGETLGIVGESGCGKTVTGLSILQLIDCPPGKIVAGKIIFKGRDLIKLRPGEMRKIRGKEIAMIFQEPMTSLNPVYTIGKQISEAILVHNNISKKEVIARTVGLLKKVEIPSPEKVINAYPHQLSGGMRQRAMIAIALSCGPQLLIADEPTTALDVTIQDQILDLINSFKRKYNMSIMMITHDLGVIAEISDRVAVMYAGRIVEYADVGKLFAGPKHPYTLGLMASIPKLNKQVKRLQTIPGIVPDSINFPKGCRFNNRCLFADDKCKNEEPGIEEVEVGHYVSCWHYK